MSGLRPRLTYANVMATLAVFIALGAGAYAAGLGRNSVKSKQIKAGAVKTDELADNAVTSPKVADGSLQGADFAAGQLPTGATGPQGEQGVAGTARAYGTIRPQDCVVVFGFFNCTAVRAKGIASVVVRGGNVYCVPVPGVDAREVSAVVSVDNDSTTDPVGNASVAVSSKGPNPSSPFCGDETAFVVRTYRQASVTVDKGGGNNNQAVSSVAAGANDVGFTIIVP